MKVDEYTNTHTHFFLFIPYRAFTPGFLTSLFMWEYPEFTEVILNEWTLKKCLDVARWW